MVSLAFGRTTCGGSGHGRKEKQKQRLSVALALDLDRPLFIENNSYSPTLSSSLLPLSSFFQKVLCKLREQNAAFFASYDAKKVGSRTTTTTAAATVEPASASVSTSTMMMTSGDGASPRATNSSLLGRRRRGLQQQDERRVLLGRRCGGPAVLFLKRPPRFDLDKNQKGALFLVQKPENWGAKT